jgi:hypothetical protein
MPLALLFGFLNDFLTKLKKKKDYSTWEQEQLGSSRESILGKFP